MLLQFRDHKCCQHVLIMFPCDRAGFEPSWSHFFKRIRPNDGCCGETAPYRNLCKVQGYLMDCARVFTCPNAAAVRMHLTIQDENGPHLSKGLSTAKQHRLPFWQGTTTQMFPELHGPRRTAHEGYEFFKENNPGFNALHI